MMSADLRQDPLSGADLFDRIRRQTALVFAAREIQAIDAGMMFDSVSYGGVVYFRPTLAHIWLMMEMERLRMWDEADKNMRIRIFGWLLTFPANRARNELYRSLLTNPDGIRLEASLHFSDNAGALAVVSGLMIDLDPKSSEPDDDMLQPGWWARCIHQIASTYHWTEDQIFAVPVVRLAAYNREAAGGDCRPDAEMLPEEIELGRLLRLRKDQNYERGKKPADPPPRQ